MQRLIAIAALLTLAACQYGCASLAFDTPIGNTGDTDTYAKCAAADVASTALYLSTTHMSETNPLVTALKIKALGHVLGTLVPAVGWAVAIYYALKWLDKPEVTATATVATCFAAGRNLYYTAPALGNIGHSR